MLTNFIHEVPHKPSEADTPPREPNRGSPYTSATQCDAQSHHYHKVSVVQKYYNVCIKKKEWGG